MPPEHASVCGAVNLRLAQKGALVDDLCRDPLELTADAVRGAPEGEEAMGWAGISSTALSVRIGVLGTGGIATVPYGVLPNLPALGNRITLAAVADTNLELAANVGDKYGVPAFESLSEMAEVVGLDAIVNLTPIPAHYQTNREALEHGLHVVSEKPLASTLEQADELIELARSKDLLLLCAPPDMLYEPYERAAELVAAGAIGRVAFARVRSSHAGPGGDAAGWPSDPSWFYQKGSGPLLDMGVYGIHEITGILGPARRVSAFSGIT